MKKHWYKWGLAFLLALVCFNLSIVSFASAHATTPKTATTDAPLTPGEVQRILRIASPYVHVVKNKATIDPAISAHLSTGDIAIVETYVKKFNARLQTQATSANMRPLNQTAGVWWLGCYASITAGNNWWGTSYFMNHCLINNTNKVGINGLTTTILGGLLGLLGGPIAGFAGGAAGALIGLYIGALVTADSNCGNRGAYLDSVFGVWVVYAVC